MLKSRKDAQRGLTAEEIIKDLFDMGYSEGELHQLVSAKSAQIESPINGSAPASTVGVYESVPSHLATVPEIASQYRVSRQAVYQWIEQGHTPVAGLLTSGSGGQKNVTLLDRQQVADYSNTRSPFDSVDDNDELPVFEELPPHLIDLPTAARKHDRPVGTLHGWVKNGLLHKFGRLRAPVKGGGYIVLDRAEVESVASRRPTRARKQSL